MKALPDQPQCVHSRAPGESDPPASVAIVVDHRHPATLQLQLLPLHPRVPPAWPQTDPLAENFGIAERRLQPAATLQDALCVSFVHFKSAVVLLPRAAHSDAVYPGVDVGLSISVPDEVLQPGRLHLEDLASDWVHLVVTHERFGAQAGAVDNDVIAVAQFLKTVDLLLFHQASSFSEPSENRYDKCLSIKSV